MLFNSLRQRYDAGTVFGKTFKNLMSWIREALGSEYSSVKHMQDIRQFTVNIKGDTLVLEVWPRHPAHFTVDQNNVRIYTEMFDHLLDPIMLAIDIAKLSDESASFPNSTLKQATEEEHEFSHKLNSP